MKFTIGTVLSITHGNLLCPMDNVYQILDYMLDDKLFTHALPRAVEFCGPIILSQHPNLHMWDEFQPQVTTSNYQSYIDKAIVMFGENLEIDKVIGGWQYKNPITELEELMNKNSNIN